MQNEPIEVTLKVTGVFESLGVPYLTILVSGDAFPVLIARFRAAPVWVVSDPDLLNTMSVAVGPT